MTEANEEVMMAFKRTSHPFMGHIRAPGPPRDRPILFIDGKPRHFHNWELTSYEHGPYELQIDDGPIQVYTDLVEATSPRGRRILALSGAVANA